MTTQDAFKQLVAELRPTFNARAFQKKGLTFYRRIGDNFGLVQLQKGRGSTAAEVEFTINLGIFSTRVQRALAQIMWVPEVTAVPTEPDCHLSLTFADCPPNVARLRHEETNPLSVPELAETVRSVNS